MRVSARGFERKRTSRIFGIPSICVISIPGELIDLNNQVISIIGELHKDLYYENAFLDNVVSSVPVELHQFLKYNPDDINKRVLAKVIRRAISKLPNKIKGNAVIKRGGEASNTAEILATLGAFFQLISVIGTDFTEALEELKSIAIDSDLIRILNKKTPISTIIKSNFTTKIFVASNLKRKIDFKGLKLTDTQIKKMKLTCFASISSQFKDIINRLQHYNVIISVNLEKQNLNSLEELDNTIEQRIDLLFTSYSDISRILGKNYQVKEIDDILKKYAKIRVITEGKNGSHIFTERLDNIFISP